MRWTRLLTLAAPSGPRYGRSRSASAVRQDRGCMLVRRWAMSRRRVARRGSGASAAARVDRLDSRLRSRRVQRGGWVEQMRGRGAGVRSVGRCAHVWDEAEWAAEAAAGASGQRGRSTCRWAGWSWSVACGSGCSRVAVQRPQLTGLHTCTQPGTPAIPYWLWLGVAAAHGPWLDLHLY